MRCFVRSLAVVSCLVLLAVPLVATPALAASGPEELGLELVPYAKKIGERRYQSQRDYDGTIKFFKDKFKGSKTVRWMREVSLPAVKYIHLENNNDKAAWEGLNIYQLKSGEVRFYVLPRAVKTAALSTTTNAPSTPTAPTASTTAPAKTTAKKP